jgi:hypothetical protein
MVWVELFAMIMKMIADCKAEGRQPEDIKKSILQPTGRDWWQVRRHLRKEGVPFRDRAKWVQAYQDELQYVQGDDIDEMIEEA